VCMSGVCAGAVDSWPVLVPSMFPDVATPVELPADRPAAPAFAVTYPGAGDANDRGVSAIPAVPAGVAGASVLPLIAGCHCVTPSSELRSALIGAAA
jgi:hypothetical protein